MFNGRRQPSYGGTSRMTRECQVRICERLGVKFPGPTRPIVSPRGDDLHQRIGSVGRSPEEQALCLSIPWVVNVLGAIEFHRPFA